ncbi:hypothetical protein A3K24_03175 [candidate division Kazan bacterium RIFCSPHIGHO2_01_FULL_44_14]|uniref:Addiction module toxin RelE n=1 Tax=candidate division Kazan bacterium RIFCSPLOWO2_01_FULL_45_19 TaxID=1798538 RepID=A0A1F4NQW3_UNCK3|nr:hypothetical protein [uncultured bacterium]OGB73800.1 MAG: hypothetical protein A3K51_03175 [candidate division Kazan bacterium RIFCSPLOWO2_01_FULL_45_19]OGB78045.1 MAG: hypothetical protein A3K24_03175 [candidate division Kazan bacterium RIFCSPHIGHO2_01_FULL_44_14]
MKMKVFIDSRIGSFIDNLSEELQADVWEYIKLLEDNGFTLFPPVFKKLSGHKLWELRPKNVRLLLGKIKDGVVVVVGFYKTTNQTPQRHIKLALERMKLWQTK